MEVLYGARLWQEFQRASNKAKFRVWISSPYLGSWPYVASLLGTSWWRDSVVELRLLTDMQEYSDPQTLSRLFDRSSESKHLLTLHAKLYIFDQIAIVTSANLTRRGFDQNVEIGMLLVEEVAELAKWFENRWKEATRITAEQVKEYVKHPPMISTEKGRDIESRWKLGALGSFTAFSLEDQNEVSDYRQFRANHMRLRELYFKIGRLWSDVSPNLEVDAFLNFLSSDHPDHPAREFFGSGSKPRDLTEGEQANEIEHFFHQFAARESQNTGNKIWRKRNYEIVQRYLAKEVIRELARDEADEVASCLHTLNSHGKRNLKLFQEPRNSIEIIRDVWRDLLHSPDGIELRIDRAQKKIHGFGRNSAQELLGWMFPEDLPIRNEKAEAGLFFLGFGYS